MSVITNGKQLFFAINCSNHFNAPRIWQIYLLNRLHLIMAENWDVNEFWVQAMSSVLRKITTHSDVLSVTIIKVSLVIHLNHQCSKCYENTLLTCRFFCLFDLSQSNWNKHHKILLNLWWLQQARNRELMIC